MGVVDDVIKPKDCVFCMCLPLTREEYFESLEESSDKTYSKIRQKQLRYNRQYLWEQDHLPLVNLFNAKRKELEELGVNVLVNFPARDLGCVNSYKAAAIFAHHDDDQKTVEFFDGMHSVSAMMNYIPKGYNRILDLTTCQSVTLQTSIKKNFPECVVVANKMNANPEFRLLCYTSAIKLLQTHEINYIDAIAEIRIQLLKKLKK
jgi:hypothetical protein